MNFKVQNAAIGYDGHPPLLHIDSWEAKGGGFHALLGSNGSGKSTLLRTLLGIHPLISGSVALVDKLHSFTPSNRDVWVGHVAFVPSTPPRQVGLSVREVLELSGNAKKAAKIHPRLTPWLDKRLSHLSDGQAQQVMVARATLQSSHWVILDEPTAFLDVAAQRELWEMLSRHVAEGGSVIMATHDLRGLSRGIATMSDHVLERSSISVIERGSLTRMPVGATLDELESKFSSEVG